MLTTPDEHQADDQQDHDDDDDPEHFHPAWCAGIGGRVSHVRLLSSRVVVEAFIHDGNSLSRQYVAVKSDCRDTAVNVYWGGAEAVERDDRGAPPRGARRDRGHHCGA